MGRGAEVCFKHSRSHGHSVMTSWKNRHKSCEAALQRAGMRQAGIGPVVDLCQQGMCCGDVAGHIPSNPLSKEEVCAPLPSVAEPICSLNCSPEIIQNSLSPRRPIRSVLR